MARTFQNIRLFPQMSALENVLVGRHCRTRAGVLAAIGRGPAFRREERESEARATELLAFVGLSRAGDTLAKNLPYGDQRRLEIARALATDPGLLLLDEPTAGMNPNETAAAMDLVRRVRDQGIAVVGHRARHAVHLQPVRPGGGAGAGVEAGGGDAGRGPVRRPGHRGLPGRAGRPR